MRIDPGSSNPTDTRRDLLNDAACHGHTTPRGRYDHTLANLVFVVPVNKKHADRQRRIAARQAAELGALAAKGPAASPMTSPPVTVGGAS